MFYDSISLIKSRVISSIDDSFRPAVLWNHAFLDGVCNSKKGVSLSIVIEKEDGFASIYKTQIFSDESNRRVGQSIAAASLPLVNSEG